MTMSVRFWAVKGRDVNADGGFIEVGDDGTVTVSKSLDWVLDLPAPVDIKDQSTPSTRPSGGFTKVGTDGDAIVFRAEGQWDAALWLDKVRYHFRTPYLRPGDVETSA
jgi:hypothetical protein